MLACAAGNRDEAMRLIQAGADINARDEDGCTALYYASGSSDEKMIDVVKALVERGADVNARRDGGFTPLHEACFSGTYAAVQFLISKGADVNAREQRGDTPLHIIAGCSLLHQHPEWGEPELIVLALLEHGAKLDARDKDGLTPPQLAAKAEPRDRTMLNFLRHLDRSPRGSTEVHPATQPAK
jgi:cytohesin